MHGSAKLNLQQDWHVDDDALATMDGSFLVSYAVGLFASGISGDASSPNKVLICG